MSSIVGYSVELPRGRAKILCPVCCREFFTRSKEPIHADEILPSPAGCSNCGRLLKTNLTEEGRKAARTLLSSFMNNPDSPSVNRRFCRHLYHNVIV